MSLYQPTNFGFLATPSMRDITSLQEQVADLQEQVADLRERVLKIESSRPGRKGTPVIVSEKGVCGLDPACDSETCERASVYRWQKGCRGTACAEKNSAYYSDYRRKQRGTNVVEVDEPELVAA